MTVIKKHKQYLRCIQNYLEIFKISTENLDHCFTVSVIWSGIMVCLLCMLHSLSERQRPVFRPRLVKEYDSPVKIFAISQ